MAMTLEHWKEWAAGRGRRGMAWLLSGILTLSVLMAASGCGPERVSSPPYDLLLQGGIVVDGTGADRFEADLAVSGDRIARVAHDGLPADSAREVVEAEGLLLVPGFVDHHPHRDPAALEASHPEGLLRQGITTVLAAPATGVVPPPSESEDSEFAPNVGFLVSHAGVREEVVGLEARPATADEVDAMEFRVASAMRQGALGLASSLDRGPERAAQEEELLTLAEAAGRRGGLHYARLRTRGPRLEQAVDELLSVGRQADVPIHIQGHTPFGPTQWGRTQATLALMDSARAQGVSVTHDVAPYAADGVPSSALLPAWAAQGPDSLKTLVEDPEVLDVLEREMRELWMAEWTGDDLSRIRLLSVPEEPDYEGLTLEELVRDRGLPLDVEGGIALAVELELNGGFAAALLGADEGDLIRVMEHSRSLFQTGGGVEGPDGTRPHPRAYGSFPRLLRRFVGELGVLSVEEAVHRMSGLSMERLGQEERGVLLEGRYADVVVLEPGAVEDRATFMEPQRHAAGVVHSVVNGVHVIRDGSLTGHTPGAILRGPAR